MQGEGREGGEVEKWIGRGVAAAEGMVQDKSTTFPGCPTHIPVPLLAENCMVTMDGLRLGGRVMEIRRYGKLAQHCHDVPMEGEGCRVK
jgi:hypothetical protein